MKAVEPVGLDIWPNLILDDPERTIICDEVLLLILSQDELVTQHKLIELAGVGVAGVDDVLHEQRFEILANA